MKREITTFFTSWSNKFSPNPNPAPRCQRLRRGKNRQARKRHRSWSQRRLNEILLVLEQETRARLAPSNRKHRQRSSCETNECNSQKWILPKWSKGWRIKRNGCQAGETKCWSGSLLVLLRRPWSNWCLCSTFLGRMKTPWENGFGSFFDLVSLCGCEHPRSYFQSMGEFHSLTVSPKWWTDDGQKNHICYKVWHPWSCLGQLLALPTWLDVQIGKWSKMYPPDGFF